MRFSLSRRIHVVSLLFTLPFLSCLLTAEVAAQVQAPPAPVATAATNTVQTSFSANWQSAVRATSYWVQVATDTIFRLPVPGYNNDSVGNVLTLDITGLTASTTYYYRVRASNAGGFSPVSNRITVTTLVPPPFAPKATLATNIRQTSFTANWDTSSGATTYLLDVATDTNFTAILKADSSLIVGDTTAYDVTGLSPGSKYYYRVRGANPGGESGNSNVVSFTTVVATPPAPVATPATNVLLTSFSANWNAAPGATTYFLDVATDTNFASILKADSSLNVGNTLARNVTGLSPGTKYFYRVRGSNVGGTSLNSNTVAVITVPLPPVAAPATNVVQTSFTANWNASAGAATYLLDVATDTNFTSILPAFNNLNVGNVFAQNLGGLTAGTKYFYRVRGGNSGGTSANSNTISVTTVVAAPPAPVATPATNVLQTSFTANWNPSAGAVSYFFDAAVDSNFSSLLTGYGNLNAGNVLAQNVTGLSPGTKYYYRVRGSNAGGTSLSSNRISVTTVGVPPPAPLLATPSNGATGQPVALTLTWSPSAGAITYVVNVSISPSFAPAFINDTSVAGTSRALTGLAPNTTYYWRVAARNLFGLSTFSSPVFSFSTVAATVVTGIVAFPANPGLSDYRMVGIPGASPGVVSDLTAGSGETPKSDWRVFRAQASALLAELAASDQFGVGEGVWLIRKNTLSITKSPAMPPLQPDGTFSIQIHDGWNIVADPFDQPVRWGDVRGRNGLGLADVIQGWTGSYAVDTVMEPFTGYYFFNASPGVTALAIPYPLPAIPQPPPSNVQEVAWSLHVAFETPDNVDNDCHLGVLPAAAPAGSSPGIRKPPLAFPGGEIYFSRPGPDGKTTRFSTDYRPELNGCEEWDVEVSRSNGCTGTLRFTGFDAVPSNYRIVLVTPDEGFPIDLRSQGAYRLQSPSTSLSVRILIGLEADVQRQLSDLIPVSFTLGQNYPNPFNPATTIRYGLPRDSHVRLTVYNVLGQQVSRLVDEDQRAGFHEVKFDGTGLASGMYFFRMEAGSFVQTKRLLLVR